jgi:hypothetical protein
MDFFPLQNNDQKSFYAVFDGHAGMEAASYAAAHVPYHFVKSESFPRDPPGALKTAFKSTDENFIVKATREVPYLAVYYTHIYSLHSSVTIKYSIERLLVIILQREKIH